MSKRHSRILGSLRVPKGIPAAEFDEENRLISQYAQENRDVWFGFSSAWNGLAYRLIAAQKYAQEFSESTAKSSAPESDERYLQDHSLFGFFTCATSSIDCFFFASYCVANLVDEDNFPIEKNSDLRFSPNRVYEKFSRFFPQDNIASEMDICISSNEYREIKDHRNVLTHQGTHPRQHYFSTVGTDTPSTIPGNPRDLPSQWNYAIPLDPAFLRGNEDFLYKTQEKLIYGLLDFTNNRLHR